VPFEYFFHEPHFVLQRVRLAKKHKWWSTV